MREVTLTGVERFFEEDQVIVSKTDLRGKITYANRVFISLAGYTEDELVGAPHSIIRHPAMPRCVFKYLWDTIAQGSEVFAYVVNRARNGDHYWVFAHVTPSYDRSGNIVGYHSSRRVPNKTVVQEKVVPLYRMLLDEEKRHPDRQQGLTASFNMLVDLLKSHQVSYDEWIFSL